MIHVASMSNLFAAIGWMLVDLLSRPSAGIQVAQGDGDWAKRCALESIRLAQRSIMSRYVLKPIALADTDCTYQVATGVTIATLLPMTNTSAGPGLGDWDPDRWRHHRLVRPPLATPELVTVFGHGKHTCPAQPFAVSAMSATATRLLATYEWESRWQLPPRPVAPRSAESPVRPIRVRQPIDADRTAHEGWDPWFHSKNSGSPEARGGQLLPEAVG